MKTINVLLATALLATSATAFAQTVTITSTSDSTVLVEKHTTTRKANRVRSEFQLYLGLNGLGGTLPAGYDFRPGGSRFVALAWQTRIPLAVNGSTKLRLITGPEVAWNNFMLEGRNTLTEQNNQLVIEQADKDLRKSKLVTAQLNLPVMLNVAFKSGFSMSAGAYAGIRLDSYTKVKPVGGSSVRTHGSYNLNTIRWGLTTELGYKGHGKLFGRYEPNSLFRDGQGPDASVWTVGVKF